MSRMRVAALVFGALALFGACAEDDPTIAEPAPTLEAEETDEGSAGGIEQARTVQVAEVGELGEVLVNEDQHTLYLFEQDTGEDSTCTGACAETWPALDADDPTAGDGVDEAKLSTNDAGQVVYNGHPLYTYSEDTEPGQANGQGIGGNWFAVTSEGDAVPEE